MVWTCVSQGYTFPEAGEKEIPHPATRRDTFCDNCTCRKGRGNRRIPADLLRIIPGELIKSHETTCQQAIFVFKDKKRIVIKKRSVVSGPMGMRQRMQELTFEGADGNKSTILMVDHQEVGGQLQSLRHANGNARVPPKHFGEGASVVCVFESETIANEFDTRFRDFTDQVQAPWRLASGSSEQYVFDSKRASMAPYCSILTRVCNSKEAGPCDASQAICVACKNAPRKAHLTLDQCKSVTATGNDVSRGVRKKNKTIAKAKQQEAVAKAAAAALMNMKDKPVATKSLPPLVHAEEDAFSEAETSSSSAAVAVSDFPVPKEFTDDVMDLPSPPSMYPTVIEPYSPPFMQLTLTRDAFPNAPDMFNLRGTLNEHPSSSFCVWFHKADESPPLNKNF